MMPAAPEVAIFDVDGTLYEEPAVYERFAAELARLVPTERGESFLTEWRDAAAGRHSVRVGMGYDTRTDLLFRHLSGRIVGYLDWDGHSVSVSTRELEVPNQDRSGEHPAAVSPIETPLFGEHALNIGDMWGLTDVIAAHHGLSRSQRSAAFLATRAAMDQPDFPLRAAPGLAAMLGRLRGQGTRTIAMTNSPEATTRAALEKLGIRELFDAVHAEARKPRGLRALLAAQGAPERALVIGDNYANEIEPALLAGAAALYIDRFATGFGADQPRCVRVASIPAMIASIDT